MIKESLLNALKGLSVDVAIKRCSRKGLKSIPLKEGSPTTGIARPKTVMIYYNDATDLVVSAYPGDSLELLKGE